MQTIIGIIAVPLGWLLSFIYSLVNLILLLINKYNTVDFINDELLNNEKFAGNYNIPHIIRQIKVYLKEII